MNKRMKNILVNVEFVSLGDSVKELEVLSVSCIRIDVLLCRERGRRGGREEGGRGGREEGGGREGREGGRKGGGREGGMEGGREGGRREGREGGREG